MARSYHWRWVSSARCAQAFSKITWTDQRMTTHGRICSGVACGSVQKKASRPSFPAGSPTSTKRMSTGGKPRMYHSAVPEKTQNCLRCPRASPLPHRGEAHQDVVERTPIDPGARRQRDDRALRLSQPRAPGEPGRRGGRHLSARCGGPGPSVPTQRRPPWRSEGAGDGGHWGFRLGDAPPTREATGSTGWGAVRRTDRLGAGVSPRLPDDVLVPAARRPAV